MEKYRKILQELDWEHNEFIMEKLPSDTTKHDLVAALNYGKASGFLFPKVVMTGNETFSIMGYPFTPYGEEWIKDFPEPEKLRIPIKKGFLEEIGKQAAAKLCGMVFVVGGLVFLCIKPEIIKLVWTLLTIRK